MALACPLSRPSWRKNVPRAGPPRIHDRSERLDEERLANGHMAPRVPSRRQGGLPLAVGRRPVRHDRRRQRHRRGAVDTGSERHVDYGVRRSLAAGRPRADRRGRSGADRVAHSGAHQRPIPDVQRLARAPLAATVAPLAEPDGLRPHGPGLRAGDHPLRTARAERSARLLPRSLARALAYLADDHDRGRRPGSSASGKLVARLRGALDLPVAAGARDSRSSGGSAAASAGVVAIVAMGLPFNMGLMVAALSGIAIGTLVEAWRPT